MMPIIFLAILSIVLFCKSVLEVAEKGTLQQQILLTVEIGNLVHNLQIERGTTALYVSSGGSSDVMTVLQARYAETDKTVAKLNQWPRFGDPAIPPLASKEEFHRYVRSHRENLQPNETSIEKEIGFYSARINDMIKVGNDLYGMPLMHLFTISL